MDGLENIPFLDLRAINARYADELKVAAARVIDAGWYVLGQELAAFEEEFASYCGAAHAVGVGNGLDALSLILRGYRELGVLREGDEIIVPANTFIASFLAISQNQLVLVPVEPDPLTFNMDPAGVEKAIGPRTRAIMAVHLYGQLADMAALQTLAHRYGLLLIEDAAQAHGARAGGRRAGAFGDAAAFSFSDQEPGRTRRWWCGGDLGSASGRAHSRAAQLRLGGEISPHLPGREFAAG